MPAEPVHAEPAAAAPAAAAPAPARQGVEDAAALIREGERHLRGLRQLTFGGENAEAYFSVDEQHLVFQSTRDGRDCDQIYTLDLATGATQLVSTGRGRTTCAYYLPGDQRLLYASTHAADPGCLPPPDRSHGYVWKLYDEFDIYTAPAGGGDPTLLVGGPGYDAEATISPRGDRIVFTSTRDGDPELYSVDLEGGDLRRLTHTPGYDGGAFFSPDGARLVYRANHPEGEEELAKYREIQREGLVRPTRLELFVMNADGSDQRQITRNGKANFGPYFHPDGRRIIFSTNLGDPLGRGFDLYMIGDDGEGLEQITTEPTFDGFPMFTRDGARLVFASNRGGAARGDTNVFIADWQD
ncbi:MAG: PD40 domain-containing protein [Nannocystis sp.]|nr:PD40 domain-containing protein [Nannocystis sp.]